MIWYDIKLNICIGTYIWLRWLLDVQEHHHEKGYQMEIFCLSGSCIHCWKDVIGDQIARQGHGIYQDKLARPQLILHHKHHFDGLKPGLGLGIIEILTEFLRIIVTTLIGLKLNQDWDSVIVRLVSECLLYWTPPGKSAHGPVATCGHWAVFQSAHWPLKIKHGYGKCPV